MRARVPPDVPLHRHAVGADPTNMGSLMPPRIVKPYVYRGIGVDTLTAHLGEDEVRAETIRKAAEAREARKARPKPKPKPKRRKPKARKPYKPRLYPYYGPEHVLEPPPPPPPVYEEYYGPVPINRPIPQVRPAKGWQPLKGDDIDALLDELSD